MRILSLILTPYDAVSGLLRLPATLAARLTLGYTGVFILLSMLVFMIFYFVIDSVFDHRMKDQLVEDVQEYRDIMACQGITRLLQELAGESQAENHEQFFFSLYDPEGNRVFSTNLSSWNETQLNRIAKPSETIRVTDMQMAEDDEQAAIAYGSLADDYYLITGESLEDKKDFMELMIKVFMATIPILILLGATAGWVMARHALRGVEEVSRAAIDVAQGNLDRRVAVSHQGEEIQRLVDTFNAMAERLLALITGMRGMTDNIAHDLRSPLARIRAGAEQALTRAVSVEEHQRAAVNTLEECDRLLHMINTTLDVAETEAGVVQLRTSETDLSQITLDACELYEPLAEDKNISISREIESGCTVKGNTSYLQRMFANLLDNALKYTPAKGKISVKLNKNGAEVFISVTDTGVGINSREQHKVFDRFFRCDASRSEPGCGLGLSLARAIAQAHGGDIKLDSKIGAGSTFTVILQSGLG